MSVMVRFGALAPPLKEQLRGFVWAHEARSFQKMADAIVLLSIHGYLSDSERDRARHRLLAAIRNRALKKREAA